MSCQSAPVPDTRTLPPEAQHTMLALGDSLTAGYQLPLHDSYPAQLKTLLQNNGFSYEIINAGVSGDTSEDVLNRVMLYDDLDIDSIILSIGGNDGLRTVAIEDIRQNITAIISHLQKIHPEATIVLCGMQIPLNAGVEYTRDFAHVFEAVSTDTWVLLYPFLLEGVAKQEHLNLSDGIHPNATWYAVVAHNLFTFLHTNNVLR